EHLEEQPPGQVLDPQREAVVSVVPAVQDQAREVVPPREAPGQELMESRGGKGAASQQMDAQTVPRKGARHVDDLAVAPIEAAPVGAARDRDASGAPVQLHPLKQVGESEDLQAAAQVFSHVT